MGCVQLKLELPLGYLRVLFWDLSFFIFTLTASLMRALSPLTHCVLYAYNVLLYLLYRPIVQPEFFFICSICYYYLGGVVLYFYLSSLPYFSFSFLGVQTQLVFCFCVPIANAGSFIIIKKTKKTKTKQSRHLIIECLSSIY